MQNIIIKGYSSDFNAHRKGKKTNLTPHNILKTIISPEKHILSSNAEADGCFLQGQFRTFTITMNTYLSPRAT
jgi:hypothetical protein